MEIGKPRRNYRVEPLREPVPSKQQPQEAPRPERRQAPSPVPAK
jgi:hypothetical protein